MSTQVDCRKNAGANLNSSKMVDIDIGNHALGVRFCHQIFILKMLALA